MKPRIIIGLSSLILWLPGIINADAKHRPLWIFILLFVLLAYLLFTGNRRAFRIYRALLWFNLVSSTAIILLSMSGVHEMHQLTVEFTRSSSLGAAVLYILLWIVVLGAILYYSDKEDVRAAYGLEPKKRAAKDQPEAEHSNP